MRNLRTRTNAVLRCVLAAWDGFPLVGLLRPPNLHRVDTRRDVSRPERPIVFPALLCRLVESLWMLAVDTGHHHGGREFGVAGQQSVNSYEACWFDSRGSSHRR